MKNIAFLGTGLMGAPMAQNLIKAGYQVTCYNRTAAKTDPVVRAGGKSFASPKEAAQSADMVISCVTDGPDVENVFFGPEGAAQGAAKGTLFIDMSTIAPAVSVSIGKRLAAEEFRFLEAPITGGTIGAINGTLNILVGGSASDFDKAMPVFKAMGKTITHCGGPGTGQGVKLCNQIMGALNILGVCEAFALARGLGVDPRLLSPALSGGAASSWALQNLAPKIATCDWTPGFMIDTAQKDMRLVLEAAEQGLTSLPGSALVTQLWRSAQAYGDGADGIHALDKVLQRLANNPG
jgi:3-hydroxyisobutyrate dehydrogenase